MFKIKPAILLLFSAIMLFSCSKKSHPSVPASTNTETVKNEPVKAKPKKVIPKVIIVNDKVASKSIDGRYYYDLDGHRYWRNNKDGKYYLFHKSMFDDEAFKAKAN